MKESPDVSLLMPTHNDSRYVSDAIQSVLNQSFENWELVIIDDESTDKAPEIIRQFTRKDNRIKYLRKKHGGQLNALMHGVGSIRGKCVSILHSDDELLDEEVLKKNVIALRNSDCDGVFCDLLKMDENAQIYGRLRTVKTIGIFSPALLFLGGGSNIIPDFFFVRREAFDNVLSNYIVWNMPYWIKPEENRIGTLKLKKVDPWYKYRVYSENYIRSEIGKFEMAHGCLRTVIEIGRRIDLPFFKVQKLLAKTFKTRLRPLFRTTSCSPKRTREIIWCVLNNFFNEIPRNIYFDGLIGFYDNFPSDRAITLHSEKGDEIFQGKDSRIFFNLMTNKKLPIVYRYVLEEATKGFGKVVVQDEEEYEKAKNIMRFLNLVTNVEME